jgi:cell wall-associated NlpC family hydrolase
LSATSFRLPALALTLLLVGCGSTPSRESVEVPVAVPPPPQTQIQVPPSSVRLQLADDAHAQEAAIYALALIGNHYRFGGRNPDSGVDCSGMVSWIYEQVAGLQLPHNAEQIASLSRPVAREALQPGDLVFFNTSGKPYSHVGIYAGDGRFVHAPSSRGKYVRTDTLDSGWFAQRVSGLRTLRRPG